MTTTRSTSPLSRLGLCLEDDQVCERLLRAARQSHVDVSILDSEAISEWMRTTTDSALILDGQGWLALEAALVRPDRACRTAQVAVLAAPELNVTAKRVARLLSEAPPRTDAEAQDLLERLRSGATASGVDRRRARENSRHARSDLDRSDPAYRALEPVLHLNVDVLITGETGCGKDRMARHIHRCFSPGAPFIAVNCSAIPESIAEAELFGHEAGAFTGAIKARPGHLAAAHGGVLYLDEINSCPLWLQAKLLRALQDKGVTPVGSSKFRESRFRLIASTQRPLEQLVQEGHFRADLYYRLKVFEVHLEPIRSNPDRILKYFSRMCTEIAREYNVHDSPLTPTEIADLLGQSWPGNFRELRTAALRRVLRLTPSREDRDSVASLGLKPRLAALERALLQAALDTTRGNVASAAKELGIPAASLHYRMNRLGLKTRGHTASPS